MLFFYLIVLLIVPIIEARKVETTKDKVFKAIEFVDEPLVKKFLTRMAPVSQEDKNLFLEAANEKSDQLKNPGIFQRSFDVGRVGFGGLVNTLAVLLLIRGSMEPLEYLRGDRQDKERLWANGDLKLGLGLLGIGGILHLIGDYNIYQGLSSSTLKIRLQKLKQIIKEIKAAEVLNQ